MRFRVLGSVEVHDQRRRVVPGGPKQRTVLALLIASTGAPVTTDALIRGVYGEEAPSGARRSIQTYVSNLRSELGDVIQAAGSGYRLDADRADVDALAFEDIVAEASSSADPETKAARLREALALWRGHPYADVDGMATLTAEIGRLNELRARAIEERIQADLELGRHRDLVAELDSLTEEYPLRERFRAHQMLALYRCGRQAEALRAYEKTRSYLVEEMGLDPSRELRELEQRILEQDPKLASATSPSVRRAAILVADVADPRMLSTLDPVDRETLIQQQSEAIDDATHDAGGELFAHRGSAIYASFGSADAAVAAAVIAQQTLGNIRHPMRMGIAVGEVQVPNDGSIQGPPLTRAAHLVAAGHGGQVLLSPEANQALIDSGEAGWVVRSLGQHDLDRTGETRAVYQLVIDGLPSDFAPLRTELVPPPLPMNVRGLPGYELREQVGSGAFGVVHRAYQPSVGREVAIKVIRPEFASAQEFIRSFEVEAQLVARLEHPHIVPLHDYWRSPDGAYLVMRWLRGGSLADRLARGPLTVEQASALVDQVGPALAFAHRHGVVHRDLKPSNVLLDEDGVSYLSDFGIARMEPASERGGVVEDVRSFASVIAIALHGRDIEADVERVLTDARSDDSPYSDVGAFVEAWTTAVGGLSSPDHTATYTETRNPYKGLRAFGELDADDFFGRDSEVADIVDALRDRRLVAVVGPSGIGKSSVTRAGAIPALRQGAIEGSEDWLMTDMVPGAYPFEELAAALMRVSVEPPRQMEEELRASDRSLVRYVKRYLPEGSTLLLVIDQFEELFTLSSEAERTEFLAMLASTTADERTSVRVVITMRADFFDRPLRFAELGEALREGTIPIAAPDRASLTQIVAAPAASVGVRFSDGLVDRMVIEVQDQPGALPLTQYALAELFESRRTNTIGSEEYEAAGGVLGALGTRAEATFAGLSSDDQVGAQRLFLRMVRVADDGRATRRRVKVIELDDLDLGAGQSRAILEAFTQERLLTFDTDDTSRMPTVEVAHEAIFSEWQRLADWIDEVREDLVMHARLAMAVEDWEASSRNTFYLLSAGRLAQHESWVSSSAVPLSTSESEFLGASRTAESERVAKRRRTRRLVTGGFALAAVAGLVLAAVALGARGDAQHQAEVAKAEALASSSVAELDEDSERSVLLAIQSLHTWPTDSGSTALNLALARHNTVWQELVDTEGCGASSYCQMYVAADRPDRLIGYKEATGTVELLDITTNEVLWRTDLYDDPVLMFMPWIDGDHVIVGVSDLPSNPAKDSKYRGVFVLDLADGTIERYVRLHECSYLVWNPGSGNHTAGRPFLFATSPTDPEDSALCDTTFQGWGGFFVHHDLQDPDSAVLLDLPYPDLRPFDDPQVTRDGSLAVLSTSDSAYVFDAQTGGVVQEFSPGRVAISADGSLMAAGGSVDDPIVALRQVPSWEVISTFPDDASRLVISEDNTRVISLSYDGTTKVVNVASGKVDQVVRGGSTRPLEGTFAVDERAIVIASPDNNRVVLLEQQQQVESVFTGVEPNDPGVDSQSSVLRFHGDLAHFPVGVAATLETDDIAKVRFGYEVRDIATGRLLREAAGRFMESKLSPSGSLIAESHLIEAEAEAPSGFASQIYGPVSLVDARSGEVKVTLDMCSFHFTASWSPGEPGADCIDSHYVGRISDIEFSADETLIAIDSMDARPTIFDTATGEVVWTTEEVVDQVRSIVISPDNKHVVYRKDLQTNFEIQVVEIATGETVAQIPGCNPNTELLFSDDGTRLVGVDWCSDTLFVDTADWSEIGRSQRSQGGSIHDMALNGTIVATVGSDDVVRIVEWTEDAVMLEWALPDTAWNVEWIDDRHLAVLLESGRTLVFTIDNDELVEVAISRLTRDLTASECADFGLDPCPRYRP